uniref:Uncharacterized protein n=1 Tax=Arundo donax TaxID=35708 RepID=A0A0A9B1U9_ARUDO
MVGFFLRTFSLRWLCCCKRIYAASSE